MQLKVALSLSPIVSVQHGNAVLNVLRIRFFLIN